VKERAAVHDQRAPGVPVTDPMSSPADRDLSVVAAISRPLPDLPDFADAPHYQPTRNTHDREVVDVHHALALTSLAPTDWTFIAATVGTINAHQTNIPPLALYIATDRDSGYLPPGHPIGLDYVERVARADYVDGDGQVHPVLSARQEAAAAHYLTEHDGRADVDFLA
jgi:hypothetical protein